LARLPVWKNIKAPLVQYMETMKADRLKRDRQALIISRKSAAIDVLRKYKISHLPVTEVMPEPADFCAFPEVQAILELPNEDLVEESSFSELVPLLPNIFDRWRMDVNQRLTARVRQAHEDERAWRKRWNAIATTSSHLKSTDETLENPAEKMKLATTVFKCRACMEMDDDFQGTDRLHQLLGNVNNACHRPFSSTDVTNPLFYPKILGHQCLTVAPDKIMDLPSRDPSIKLHMDLSTWVPFRFRHRQRWDPGCLAIDARAGEIVEHFIRACGLDPTITTADDMDKLDARLGCSECIKLSDAEHTASIAVFGWRSAVSIGFLLFWSIVVILFLS
jgi:hypothetical protein